MGLYEGIKDVAKVVQQADNIELYRRLLDLSAQALDLQDQISKLKEENVELKKINDIESRIIKHKHPYITIDGEDQDIKYCAVCWGKEQKLIQLEFVNYTVEPYLECTNCKGCFQNK